MLVDSAELEELFDSFNGTAALQRDAERLESWTVSNHVKLNETLCWILHLRQDSPWLCEQTRR